MQPSFESAKFSLYKGYQKSVSDNDVIVNFKFVFPSIQLDEQRDETKPALYILDLTIFIGMNIKIHSSIGRSITILY